MEINRRTLTETYKQALVAIGDLGYKNVQLMARAPESFIDIKQLESATFSLLTFHMQHSGKDIDNVTRLKNHDAYASSQKRLRNLDDAVITVLVDIEKLKTLNGRTNGRALGDKYLSSLASAIKSNLEQGDDAYHVGGGVFVIKTTSDKATAEKKVARISSNFQEYLETCGDWVKNEDKDVNSHISIAIATGKTTEKVELAKQKTSTSKPEPVVTAYEPNKQPGFAEQLAEQLEKGNPIAQAVDKAIKERQDQLKIEARRQLFRSPNLTQRKPVEFKNQ